MSGHLTYGGRVNEPKITFRRPLYVHSHSDRLNELSSAWSSFEPTTHHHTGLKDHHHHQPVVQRHSSDHVSLHRSHGVLPTSGQTSDYGRSISRGTSSHSVRDRSTKEKYSRPKSSDKVTRSSSSYSTLTSVPNGGLPYGTRSHDSLDVMANVYRTPPRSPIRGSPPRSNPRSVFGPANFKETKPRPQTSPTHLSPPLIVNGTGGNLSPKTRTVTRKTSTRNGTTKRSQRDSIENMKIDRQLNLSEEQLSSLLAKIDRQKQQVSSVKDKLSSREDQDGLSIRPHASQVSSTGLIKKRKVALAPPPKSYSGFTSSLLPSTQPSSSSLVKSREQDLAITIPLPSHPIAKEPSSPPVARRPVITPSSWRSGQELANRVLGKSSQTRLDELTASIENTKTLLAELEDNDDNVSSAEEEEIIVNDKKKRDRVPLSKPVNPVKQVVQLSESFHEVSKKPRSIDREAVQHYMQSKKKEKKRKLQEEKMAELKAQHERKKRREELEQRQKQIVINNLLAKQKRLEEEILNQTDTGSIHVHVHHSSPPPPTAIATTAATNISTYHPVIVSTPQLNISDHLHHQHYHQSLSGGSPPLISSSHSLYVSHSQSVSSRSVPTSRTLPVTYNIPSSHGVPTSHVVPTSHGVPSSHVVPSSHGVPSSHVVPSSHGVPSSHVVPTSHSVSSSHSVPSFLDVPVSQGVPTSHSVPTSHGISSSYSVPLLHGGPTSAHLQLPDQVRSPIRTSPPSTSPREARILALKQSALLLRQRIEDEKKKIEEKMTPKRVSAITKTVSSSPPITRSLFPSTISTSPSPNVITAVSSSSLPGVEDMYRHAAVVNERDKAATVIQAAWKGHHVRNVTHAPHPATRNVLPKATRSFTLTKVTQSSTLTKVTVPSTISSTLTKVTVPSIISSTLTKVTQSSTVKKVTIPSTVSPALTKPNVPLILPKATQSSTLTKVTVPSTLTKATVPSTLTKVTVPSILTRTTLPYALSTTNVPIMSTREGQPSVSLAPWQRSGGDHMSVINIYTRERNFSTKQNQSQLIDHTLQQLTNHAHDQLIDRSQLPEVISPLEENPPSPMADDTQHPIEASLLSYLPHGTTAISPVVIDSSTLSDDNTSSPPVFTPPQSPIDDSFIEPPKATIDSTGTSSTTITTSTDIPTTGTNIPTTGTNIPTTGSSVPTTGAATTNGQYSPRSLELKLKTELNMLEAYDEGVRHIEEVESTRAIAEAQQETVALAQILQSQRQTHQHTIQDLTNRAKLELKEAQEKFAKAHEETLAMTRKVKKLEKATDKQHLQHLIQLEEESRERHLLVTEKLTNNLTQLTSLTLQQHKPSVNGRNDDDDDDDTSNVSSSYHSEFDTDSLNSFTTEASQYTPTGPVTSPAVNTLPVVVTSVTGLVTSIIQPVTTVSTSVSSHISTSIHSPITSVIPSPITSVISSPITSVIPSPITSVIPSPITSVIPSPITSVIPSPITSVISSPITSVISSPVISVPSPITSVISSPITSVISSPVTSVIPSPITSVPPSPITSISSPITNMSTSEPIIRIIPSSPVIKSLSPQPSGGSKSDSTLTPEPPKNDNESTTTSPDKANTTLTSVDEELQAEGEISQISFRQLLPSESHRRQHYSSISSDVSENDEMISPSGGGQGDESFFGFLSRMVRQYVNEEEMRAKHQATLLKIRERAIKEKTKAELEWLKVKKKQLEKKQDDDAMPPLIKREQGALRKLKHEQAEIKRLREVQKRASQERKLMLLQQQDIARLQQSAQHYKEKIKRYSSQQRQTHSREESPIFEYSPSPSPVPSVNLEELSQDLTVSSQSIPTDIQPASSIEDNDDEMNEEDDRHSHNDSYKLRKLQQSSNATEKYLEEYHEQLKLRRKTAEELLLYKQQLLKKEKALQEEEANISLIIEEALKIDNTSRIADTSNTSGRVDTGRDHHSRSDVVTELLSSPQEWGTSQRRSPRIPEGQSPQTASKYSTDTFEISNSPPLASTPNHHIDLSPLTIKSNGEGIKLDQRLLQFQNELKEKERELEEREIDQKMRKQELLAKEAKEKSPLAQMTESSSIQEHVSLPITVSSSSSSSISTAISLNGSQDDTLLQISHTSIVTSVPSPVPSIVTSVPSPVVASVPSPIVTSVPSPNITSVPSPIVTSVPSPIVTSVPSPIVTSVPSPIVTSVPSPIVTSVPSPIVTSVPSPIVTSVPSPIPVTSSSISPLVSSNNNVIVQPSSLTTEQPPHLSPSPQPSPLSLTPDIIEIPMTPFTINQRVIVANTVQGNIRYIGQPDFAEGVWIGVELDEARGKNDGTVNGRAYFTCPPRHGVFAPPSKISAVIEEEEDSEILEELEYSSKEDDDNNDNEVSTPPAISPVHSEERIVEEKKNNVQSDIIEDGSDDEITSVSSLTVSSQTNVVEPLLEDKDQGQTDDITQQLLTNLTQDAFNAVHKIWNDKMNCSLTKVVPVTCDNEGVVDRVTDRLLTCLVETEIEVMCDMHKEKKDDDSVKRRGRAVSFSSEPLALVPSTRPLVDRITQCAWNMINDCDHCHHQSLLPSQELLDEVCNKTDVMLECEKSFANLVFDIAVDVLTKKREKGKEKISLKCAQEEVFVVLHQAKKLTQLPSLRYLHGNCRPGNKEVDFVDTILIKELRADETNWINYEMEEEEVKVETADAILCQLLDETIEIIENIYRKKNTLK